jgi:hypothetical protein
MKRLRTASRGEKRGLSFEGVICPIKGGKGDTMT